MSSYRQPSRIKSRLWIFFIVGTLLILAAWYSASRNPVPFRQATAEVANWFKVEPTAVPPIKRPITATTSIAAFTVLDGTEFNGGGNDVTESDLRNRVTLQPIQGGTPVPFASLGPMLDADISYSIMSVPALNVPKGVYPGARITLIVSSSASFPDITTPEANSSSNRASVSQAATAVCSLEDVVVLGPPEKQAGGTFTLLVAVPTTAIKESSPECFTDRTVAYPLIKVNK
jgi:hypothetical protein